MIDLYAEYHINSSATKGQLLVTIISLYVPRNSKIVSGDIGDT